ncbi:MAG: hypothetical protein BGO38_03520 [Cellulomonas sp. 73-145]|uniref:fluoride efflux transporter FluC n=1 Tax=Cellulomonas sp. 73-145 TaxID=1895739 RepID=UPI0009272E19|nr:CrcB family protein [Cellulomonas sp. 73-145]MBN9326456.1 CrcB family protein [Cellulomonas sp.]OJV57003.1 MAG: hypothetical protein BGO38_03520 [Cellulomonas sp. 73-145]
MIPVLLALAGGLGAATRFVVDGVVGRHNRLPFPLGTVVINVSGALLLGALTGLAMRYPGLSDEKVVLGTGFLGGYTTFSTASVEAVRLATGSRPAVEAVLHAVGMALLGLAAAGLGLWLTLP